MVEMSASELSRLQEEIQSELTRPDSTDDQLEDAADNYDSNELLRICEQQHETMSRQEMMQIIEKQKQEIKYLKEKLRLNEAEKDQIIENFQVSTSVLLDRLKDFEAERVSSSTAGERPQTATVLSKLTAEREGRRIGTIGGSYGGSLGPSSPSGFGTGGLGSGIDGGTRGKQGSDLIADERIKKVQVEEEVADVECPNCNKKFTNQQVVVHTIQCYRNSTKCKICNEIILKTMKREHLEEWRKPDLLIQAIKVDDEHRQGLFFDHGLDVLAVLNTSNQSAMHIAAENGSINCILDLISRGANIDPLDKNNRTPLSLAIEQNKYACVRSLIELGADIELRDSFGRTPLMFACKLGSKEMVELLLGYKADIKATNNMKETCVQFAQKSGNQELIMLIVKHGGSLRPQSAIKRPPSGMRK